MRINQEKALNDTLQQYRAARQEQDRLEQLRLAELEKQRKLEEERRRKEADERERKKRELVSRSNQEAHRTLDVVATAYIAFCNTGCIGETKTGKDVSNTIYHKGERIIAVDPDLVPLHSIVKVEYEGNSFIAYALDTGGDIQNYRIDILMETTREANNFGRKNVTLTIIREGKG